MAQARGRPRSDLPGMTTTMSRLDPTTRVPLTRRSDLRLFGHPCRDRILVVHPDFPADTWPLLQRLGRLASPRHGTPTTLRRVETALIAVSTVVVTILAAVGAWTAAVTAAVAAVAGTAALSAAARRGIHREVCDLERRTIRLVLSRGPANWDPNGLKVSPDGFWFWEPPLEWAIWRPDGFDAVTHADLAQVAVDPTVQFTWPTSRRTALFNAVSDARMGYLTGDFDLPAYLIEVDATAQRQRLVPVTR